MKFLDLIKNAFLSALYACSIFPLIFGLLNLFKDNDNIDLIISISLICYSVIIIITLFKIAKKLKINNLLAIAFWLYLFLHILFVFIPKFHLFEQSYIGIKVTDSYGYEDNEGNTHYSPSVKYNLYHASDPKLSQDVKSLSLEYEEISKSKFIFWQTGYIYGYHLDRLKESSGFQKYQITVFTSLYIIIEWIVESITTYLLPMVFLFFIIIRMNNSITQPNKIR